MNSIFGPSVDEYGEKVPFAERISFAWEKVKKAFTDVWDWLKNTPIVSFIIEKFGQLKDAIFKGGESGSSDAEAVAANDTPFMTRVLEGIKTALKWFVDNLPEIIENLKNLLKAGVLGQIISLISQIKKIFSGIGDTFKKVPNVLQSVTDVIKGFALKLKSEALVNIGKSAILFAAALGIIAGSLMALTLVDTNKLMTAGIVLAAVAGMIAVAITVIMEAKAKLDDAGTGSKGKDLLLESIGSGLENLSEGAKKYLKYKGLAEMLKSLAIALGALAAAVYVFSTMDLGKLAQGIGGVVILVGALAGAAAIMSKYSNTSFSIGKGGLSASGSSAGTGLIGMAAAVLILVKAIDDIRKYNLLELAKGVGTIGVLLLELVAASKFMSNTNIKLSSSVGLLGFALAVMQFLQVFNALKDYNIEQILNGVIAIGTVLGAVVALDLLGKYGSFKDLAEGLGMMATVIGAFGLIVAAFGALSTIEGFDRFINGGVDALVTVVKGIGSIFGELLASIVVLDVVGDLGSFGNITKGLLMLGEVIGGFGVIVSAFGALNLIPGFDEFIKGGVDVLITIAEGIGGFFGTLIGSVFGSAASSFSKHLPQVGQDLSDFMANIQGFVNGASKLNGDFLGSIGNLSLAMMEISGSNFVTSIMDGLSWLVGGTDTIGAMNKFVDLGNALSAFSESISGVDFTAVEKAGAAAQMINELSNIVPRSGGVLQWIIGEQDFSSADTQFASLGAGISSFCSSVEGMTASEDTINKASIAAQAITALTEVTPKEGGLIQWIVGAPDMANAGTDYGNLGAGIMAFSNAVSGMTASEETISKASTAAQAIAALTAVIPNEGGLFQWITGVPDLANAGTNFENLGTGVKSFCIAIGEITASEETINKASTAAQAIAALTAVIPAENGLFQWVTGAPDLENAGTNFTNLGAGVAAFCTSLGEITITEETLGKVDMAAKAIGSLTAVMPNQNGIFEWIVGAPDFTRVESDWTNLGLGVVAFCNAVSNITTDAAIIEKTGVAAEAIAKLTVTTPTEGGLFDWIYGRQDFESVPEKYSSLGAGVAAFCNSIGDITTDSEVISKASQAAKAIAALIVEIPDEGGVFQWITGAPNLETAGTSFESLGKGVTEFCNAVGEITVSSETVDKAGTAAEAIAKMTASVPKTGGLFQFVTGEVKLDGSEEGLRNLGKGAKAFCEEIEGITVDDNTVKTAGAAAEVINTLTQSVPNTGGLWQEVVGEKDLGKFGDNLGVLGGGISAFVEGTKGVTSENIETGKTAAQGMIDIINLEWPLTGGLWVWIQEGVAGSTDFSELSGRFEEIAGMAQTLATGFSDVKEESISAAKTAAQGIIDLLTLAWPTTGGIGGFFSDLINGTVVWTDLDTQIGQMTTAITDFCTSVNGETINVTSLGAAKEAAGVMLDLLSMDWPKEGGIGGFFKDLFTGSMSDTFNSMKTYMPDLGAAIKGFADNLVGVNTKAAVNAGICTDALSTIIPVIVENKDSYLYASNFAKTVGAIKLCISEFSTTAVAIDTVAISSANTSINDLMTTLSTMSNTNFSNAGAFSTALGTVSEKGISEFTNKFKDSEKDVVKKVEAFIEAIIKALNQEKDFESAGNKDAVGFYTGLSSYNDTTVKFAENLCTTVISNLDQQTAFQEAGANDALGFYTGLNSYYESTLSVASNIISSTLTSLDQQVAFQNAGSNNSLGYYTGFSAYYGSILTLAGETGTEAAKNIENYEGFLQSGKNAGIGFYNGLIGYAPFIYQLAHGIGQEAKRIIDEEMDSNSPSREMYKRGMWFAQGLALGIADYAVDVNESAGAVAEGAKGAVDQKMDSHSPSREMYKRGMWFSQGMAMGISDYGDDVNASAQEVASGSMDTIKTTLSNMSFEESMNSDPIIRPVLDLSGVQRDAQQMDDMIYTNGTVEVEAAYGSMDGITKMLNPNAIIKIDTKANDELIEAIHNLHLDNLLFKSTFDDRIINYMEKDLSLLGATVGGKIDDLKSSIVKGDNLNTLGLQIEGKIDELNKAISKMKLYLDKKALVGGIAEDMDKALGKISTKKKKGVK